ncbi:MAG: hypothetical protein JWM80_3242 [Cyanobacteria bacterium RYN_339]|nr:hypothetical protein [Cyanobacteria bacterium RYN_339]
MDKGAATRVPFKHLLATLFATILFAWPSWAFAMLGNFENVAAADIENASAIARKAEAGDPVSQYKVALMYGWGQGFPQSSPHFREWLRKSAENGYYKAQGLLGATHCFSEWADGDPVEGTKWLYLARESAPPGEQEAAERLLWTAMHHPGGIADSAEESRRQANNWLREHGRPPMER